MLREIAGTMLAGAVRQAPDAPPPDPLVATLIGTGASLLLRPGRRPVGVVLLAAGGYLLWRDMRAARRAAALTPPPAPRPVPGAAAIAPAA